jgi:hypothetical protein
MGPPTGNITLPSVLTGPVSLGKAWFIFTLAAFAAGDVHRNEAKAVAAVNRGYGGRDPTQYEV